MVVPIVNPYAKKRRNSSTNHCHVNTQNTVDSTIIQQQSNCCSQQPSNYCTTNNNNSNSNTVLVVAAPVANTAHDSINNRENHQNCKNRCTRENHCTSIVMPNIGTMGIQSQKRNGQREKKENLSIRNIRRSNK